MQVEPSPIDWTLLPGIIEAAVAVRTREQFLQWTRQELQTVLPHTAVNCGAVLQSPSGLQTRSILRAEAPPLTVEGRFAQDKISLALLERWCNEQSPQFFDPSVSAGASGNTALHAVPQWAGSAAVYFCFSRIPAKLTSLHATLLELLVPHMHMALGRMAGFSLPAGESISGERTSLTKREGEILKFLGKGANNKAIAAGLSLSEHTVRHHLESIYAKLNVRSRAQAVAKTFSPANARS